MTSVFQRLLGENFNFLPEPVRRIHMLGGERFTYGRAVVVAPDRLAARVLTWIAGLPAPGENVEVFVRMAPMPDGREFWRRDFAGRRYESCLETAPDGRLIEHFGPFDLYFDIAASPESMRWSISEWRLFNMNLPAFTKPTVHGIERGDGDRFTFHVDVAFPLLGRIVDYRGVLSESPHGAPVYLYDGVCVLCDSAVRYVLVHELTPSIRFVAIQSDEGRRLARANGIDPDNPESFIFIENGRALTKSEALFALARQLRGPARALLLFRVLPRSAADFLYEAIARNRYRWFGRKQSCSLPDAAHRHRFVLPGEPHERAEG